MRQLEFFQHAIAREVNPSRGYKDKKEQKSNMSENLKAIRIIQFDDKKSSFRRWSKKFLAVAKRRGYKKVLLGTEPVPSSMDVLDETDPAQKVLLVAREANEIAYNDLILACDGDIAFSIVETAVSADLPDGDAKLAWKNLHTKFMPQTSANKVQLMAKFANSSLKSWKKDPDEWINDLEILRSRIKDCGHKIDDDDLVIHILNNLPEKYDNLVENLEAKMSVSSPLTLEELRVSLSLKFTKWKVRAEKNGETGFDEGSDDDEDEEETALMANGGFKKPFKGRCHSCGKFGHKSVECPNKNKRDNGGNGGDKGRFNGKCFYCGKWGHMKQDCNKLKADRAARSTNAMIAEEDEDEDHVYMASDVIDNWWEKSDTFLLSDEPEGAKKNIWLIDSGASAHISNSTQGMKNLRKIERKIKIGSGEHVMATHIGDLFGKVVPKKGKRMTICLKEVLVVPDMYCNLISMTKLMERGYKITGKNNEIKVEKNGFFITFDQKVRSGSGILVGITLLRRNKKEISEKKKKNEVVSAHHVLGHPSPALTRATKKKYVMCKHHLNGHSCESCIISKIRKKNLGKITGKKATRRGGRVYFDTSSIKNSSAGGSKYWFLFVDEATGHKKSYFGPAKKSLVKAGEKYVRWLRREGIEVMAFRCDDGGENKNFEKWLLKNNFRARMEYTGAATPQHNGVVERAFATLTGRVRAMMKSAGIVGKLRFKIWAECVKTATDLDGILVESPGQKSRVERLIGRRPRFIGNLRSFGEVGIVWDSKNQKIREKLSDRGFPAIFVGYADNHAGDVYRMYNYKTGGITTTRDVRFIGKYFGEIKKEKAKNSNVFYESDDLFEKSVPIRNRSMPIRNENPGYQGEIVEREILPMNFSDDDTNEEPVESENVSERSPSSDDGHMHTRSMGEPRPFVTPVEPDTQLRREMHRINDYWNTTLDDVVEFAFVGGTDDLYENPRTFDEAWNHPNENDRKSWRKAVRKEFHDMIVARKVWRPVKKATIPENRRLIGCKWVFKKKKNGVFRARLCAIGYSQIAGVDHEYAFAPVICETTYRIILVVALYYGWIMEIVDVETAFLYGDLDEEIYMKIPQGLHLFTGEQYDVDDALVLVQAMYGLVQAARQFFKKLRDTLVEKMSFRKCLSDQCLLHRTNKEGTVIVCLYIDDTLITGDEKAVQSFKLELKKYFNTKEEGEMTEYVGCMIKRFNDTIYLHQTDLIKKIDRKFGERARKLRTFKTPATPGVGILRTDEDDDVLDKESQTEYRSAVGMLLFLTKFSRPDIANAVRELSKVNNRANEAHVKEMLRTVKFVLDTQHWSLKYNISANDRRKIKWFFRALCDSDFAGDKNNRLSVLGFGIYLFGCLTSWKSRAMRTHALSSTEAEYIAMSEVCCEILFVRQILEFLGFEVEYPIVVHCDNIGAIFLANNAKVSSRTKHIDLKTHFVREYIEKGIVKIVFIRSENNDSDIWTKNVGESIFSRHTDKFMDKAKESWESVRSRDTT